MHDGLLVASSSKGAGSGAASFWVTLYTLHRRASAPPAAPRLSAKSLSVGSARQVPLYQRVLVGERGKRHGVGGRTFAPSGSVECLEMECFWGP